MLRPTPALRDIRSHRDTADFGSRVVIVCGLRIPLLLARPCAGPSPSWQPARHAETRGIAQETRPGSIGCPPFERNGSNGLSASELSLRSHTPSGSFPRAKRGASPDGGGVRRRILDYATWQFPPLLAARAALEPGYLPAGAASEILPLTATKAAGPDSTDGAAAADAESAFYPWGGALSKAAPRMR